MATLRELFLKIGIDSKTAVKGLDDVDDAADDTKKKLADLDKQVDKVSAGFSEFGSKLTSNAKVVAGVVAGATTAVGAFFATWASGTLQLERTAKAYGLTTDGLQELTYAAEKLGGEGDAITEVFKEMAIRITEVAETGTGPATDALTLLKIKAEDLKKLRPEQQFDVLADAISKVADEGTKFFLKDSLFGEEGSIKIGTLLDQGSSGIAKMRKEARELGVVLSKDAIRQGIEFRGTLFEIRKTGEGLVNHVMVRLLPLAKDIAERFRDWARANKDVAATRIEDIVRKLLELVETLGPKIGTAVDQILKLSDSVGGLDKAVLSAATAWTVFESAGKAALQSIAKEITKAAISGAGGSALGGLGRLGLFGLALGGGAAAGYGLAKVVGGDRGGQRDAASEADAAKFGEYVALAGQEGGKAETFDPSIDSARKALIDKVIESDRFRVFGFDQKTTPQVAARRKLALDQLAAAKAALDEAYASDEAHRLEVEQNSFKLGHIKKPGEKEIETIGTVLRDVRKEDVERMRRQGILDEIESRLRADGKEYLPAPYRIDPEVAAIQRERESRSTLERARSKVLQELGNGSQLTLNQLIAQAVGQNTGLGGTALRPAGLGTTINHIDATVRFDVGGITVEVPAAMAAAYNGATKLGADLSVAIRDAIQPMLDAAFRAQRGQIIG